MDYILVVSVIFFFILILLILKFGILNPIRQDLRILMYHKISAGETGELATRSTIGRLRNLTN